VTQRVNGYDVRRTGALSKRDIGIAHPRVLGSLNFQFFECFLIGCLL
jgi:hypothetical protein